MAIEYSLGGLISNKTGIYLAPIINTFNTSFLNQYKTIRSHIMAFAIGDLKYIDAKKQTHKNLLFILCDINGHYQIPKRRYTNIKEGRIMFNAFLQQFKQSKYYFDDYIYEGIISHTHVLIFQLPEEFHNAWDKFNKSLYSEMYTEQQIKKASFYREDKLGVLRKTEEYKQIFLNRLEDKFGFVGVIDDGRELDFPIKIEEEML